MKQAGQIPYRCLLAHTHRANLCEEWASIMRAIKCRKGVRWNALAREAMKDVVRCDKPWGAANRL